MLAVVPCERVAGHSRRVAVLRLVDGQVQGDNGVTILDTSQGVLVVAALRVLAVVPCERVAGHGRRVTVLRCVDRQMQRDDAVAVLGTS